jgi:hypothetical protein
MELSRGRGQRVDVMKNLSILNAVLCALCLPSCTGLTTEQNDRIIDSAIPVVREIVVRATK